MAKISVSILGADQSDLVKAALQAQQCGADFIHVDVMDGKFVDPEHYSPQLVSELAAKVSIPIEAHLMVVEPIDWVEQYAKAGAKMIAVHAEAQPPEELLPLVQRIKSLGCKAGVALNPETKLKQVDLAAFAACDYALVMSVHPGFSGQTFIHNALEKIAQFEQLSGRNGWKMQISVDGGVNGETAQDCVHAGARILVMGKAFYTEVDPAGFLAKMKLLGEE